MLHKSRVRVPTYLQMEAVECGAAALGSILAHHGLWKSLEDPQYDICDTTEDDFKIIGDEALPAGAFADGEKDELVQGAWTLLKE